MTDFSSRDETEWIGGDGGWQSQLMLTREYNTSQDKSTDLEMTDEEEDSSGTTED